MSNREIDCAAVLRDLDDIHRQHGMKAVVTYVCTLMLRLNARAEERVAALEAGRKPRVRVPAGSSPA